MLVIFMNKDNMDPGRQVLADVSKGSAINITIVGFGAAGLAFFVHLTQILVTKSHANNVTITIIDDGNLAKGVAYSVTSSEMVLNFDARLMNVTHDKQRDFMQWRQENSGKHKHLDIDLDDFYPPRGEFGAYLYDRWQQYRRMAESHGITVDLVTDTVTDIQQTNDAYLVTTSTKRIIANHVLLALGCQQKEAYPSMLSTTGYYSGFDDNISINNEKDIVILGSRLTAIDVVLDLKLRQRVPNRVHLVSDSGDLPMVLSTYKPYDLKYATKSTLLAAAKRANSAGGDVFVNTIFRELELINLDNVLDRSNAQDASVDRFYKDVAAVRSGSTINWQMVLISIYPHLHEAWGMLDDKVKDDLYHKYHHAWVKHFVSIPLKNAEKIEKLLKSGEVMVHSGIKSLEAEGADDYFVSTDGKKIHAGSIVNAIGLNHDLTLNRLLKRMYARGILSTSFLGDIRIAVNDCRIVCQNQTKHEIYAIGEYTHGSWLTVSDLQQISKQALLAATSILAGTV